MKKKILAAALVSVMAFALVACGNERPSTTVGLPTPTGQASDVTPVPQAPTTSKGLTKLGQYRGIEVEKLTLTVSEEDIDINYYMTLVDVAELSEDAVVKLYDYVNIDYVGKMNGEQFEGGTSDPSLGGSDVLIGSGSFIPGFEEGIIGMKTGETKTVKVTFPENYGSADLAGKEAEFDITVNSIKVFPEITDEMVAENTELETVDALKADIRSSLEEQAEETISKQFQSDVFDALIAGCEFDNTLQSEIDKSVEDMKTSYELTASQYGLDFETFIAYAFGMTIDVFNKEIVTAAEYNIKLEKALIAVAEAENLTVSDTDYDAYVNTIVSNYGFADKAEVESLYSPEYIKEGLLIERAQDLVMDSAVAKDAQSTTEE